MDTSFTNSLYHVENDDIPTTSITDKCVVLDLDQTLIATHENIKFLHELKILSDPKLMSLRNRTYYMSLDDLEKKGVGTKYDFWGVTRPHIHEFLVFCFSYFRVVAVWSAGTRPYVEAIVDYIFKDIRPPHIMFTQDDILRGQQGEIHKPLVKMMDSSSVIKRNMLDKNTLAIDDNPSTFYYNQDNGVLIPDYNPALNVNALARDDPTLLQLKYWLLQPEVANSKDVTKLDKSNIFTTSLESYKNKLRSKPGYSFIS